ncbi:hypothetical protein JCM8208_002557 [Rhodotorula glutinis]
MADLRNELKEWERAFKATHDRAPTKDDIRQEPSIAAKYKEYNKLRTGATKVADKPSTSRASSSSQPPPPAEASHIFKTPTKPKSSRARPRPDAISSSTDGPGPAVDASPSKRLSSSRDKPSSSSTSFIHANSPSKLRALAAAHSTSGSPNRPTSGAWASATLAPSDSLPVTGVATSPQKRARNPFASPQKGTFGELERAERERLKAKKRAERERARASGVLGGKATSRGAGWGGASSVPDDGAGRSFARTESVGSARGMEVDEVDDFFSSQSSLAPSAKVPSQSQGSQRLLAQLAKASPVRPVATAAADDDEVFGPSPVKRPSASNPLFGLSPSSSSAAAPPPTRVFKPLVPDSPPPSRPTASAAPPAKPKPFSSSLPSCFLPPAPATSRKRVPAPGDGDDDRDAADAALDDDDDDFYADALDEADAGGAKKGRAKKGAAAARGKGRAAPAKRKKVAAGAAAGAGAKKASSRAKGKGKGKAAADDDGTSSEGDAEMDVEEEDDPEVRIVSSSRARGELVLDVSRDPALGLGTGRERLVIHEKGYEARVRALEREERRRRAEERAREAGEGGDEVDEAAPLEVQPTASDEDGEDEIGDEASLFHRRAGLDLLSRLRADAASASAASTAADHADDADNDDLGASLPADLAAVLSLRASPQKKHSAALAKQRQVARLLGEPGTSGSRRRQKGLLGLDEGEVEEGEGEGAAEGEGEGDDDWDEEPDGWKATADAMDGYYSADGW